MPAVIGLTRKYVLRGDCMLPLFEPGDELWVQAVPWDAAEEGSIVAFVRWTGGEPSVVARRLLRKGGGPAASATGADSRLRRDPGEERAEFVGRVVGFRRREACVVLGEPKGRLLAAFARVYAAAVCSWARELVLCPLDRLGARRLSAALRTAALAPARLLFGTLYADEAGSVRFRAWGAALVLACVLLAYSNSLRSGFTWDDHIYVEDNDFVKHPGNLRHLLDPRFYSEYQKIPAGSRPALLGSLLVDRALWGGRPAGYHMTSVLLHAANAVWVLLLAAALWPADKGAALLAALVFALHPVQTEAVNAVSFRADLLAAFFTFAALAAWLAARRAGRAGFAAGLAACAVSCWLALVSKESAAVLPLLLLLAEAYLPSGKRSPRRLAAAAAVLCGVLALYAAFRWHRPRYAVFEAAGAEAPAGTPLYSPAERRYALQPSPPAWEASCKDPVARLRNSAAGLALELSLLARPWPLVADRVPPLPRGFPALDEAAAWGLLLLCVWAALAARGRAPGAAPAVGFGLAWCLACLLPVSGVVRLYNPVAERYLYTAVAGAAWALAWGLGPVLGRARVWAAVLLLAAFGLAARARNAAWASDETLLASVPDRLASPRVRYNRGNLLLRKGRLAEAAEEYRAALRLHPGYAEAWVNLGSVLKHEGDEAGARACYEKAEAANPRSPLPAFVFGRLLEERGDEDGARRKYEAALAAAPDFDPARRRLAALDGGAP